MTEDFFESEKFSFLRGFTGMNDTEGDFWGVERT